MRARRFAIAPPFRPLDPGLARAEQLLDEPDPDLLRVFTALLDKEKAADYLNELLNRSGATPQLIPGGGRLACRASFSGRHPMSSTHGRRGI